MSAVAEVLAKAREVLAERGHAQGILMDPATGAVCAGGALRIAVRGKPTLVGATEAERVLFDAAERELCRAARTEAVWLWNDDRHTTAEDVALGLKHAEELALERP